LAPFAITADEQARRTKLLVKKFAITDIVAEIADPSSK
jgi:hypothetical protein